MISDLESEARRFGAALGGKWRDIAPSRSGTGFMIWEDNDHCIFVEFYGDFEVSDKLLVSSAAIDAYYSLAIPHSLRIGFHRSEEIARRTMDGVG